VDAARLVHVAKERRLPCGRLSWEALAGGAVLLAARNRLEADRVPSPEEVALYTKATLERTCAAARKIRIGGDRRDLAPGRPRAVEVVLEQAGGAFGPGEILRVARVAQRLLEVADDAGIGPGTSRVTMATVAVDRATLLLGERPFSRSELVEAARRVVDTSGSRVSGYSVELKRALESRGGVTARRPSARLDMWGEPGGHEVALGRGQ
jgi:transcription initiation factor TFIIB